MADDKLVPTKKELKQAVKEVEKELKDAEKDFVKQVLAAKPELVQTLRDAGFDNARIEKWVAELALMSGLTETDMVRIAEPIAAPPVPVSAARRQLTLWRHQISHWWHHGKGLRRLIYGSGWTILLYQAVTKSALGWVGWALGLLVLGMKLRVVVGEMDPKHLPMLQRTLDERQILLKKLLHTLQLWGDTKPHDHELEAFQVDCLKLIVSLVRDHRSDLRGKQIFANLLVRRGADRVFVIARADDTREVPKEYAQQQVTVAWEAFVTGLPHMAGDLYAEAPSTTPGKSYHSVLAIPVKLQNEVLAVVSIDSEMKHHFHKYFDDLQTLLGPYVQLLASALTQDHDRNQPKALTE